MNKLLLNNNIQDFINKNLNTDITKLILKGSPFSEVSIQDLAEQITAKKKCKSKLPSWFKADDIYYPNKLNIEQTSSEITANYKASIIQGGSIIDLTGGFGVDCFAFSKKFKQVIHCEINAQLSKIAHYNYQKLNVKNIQTITGNGIHFLKETNKKYNWIYIDPSRRDDLKKRVFLLKDCLPNLPENINLLFNFSDNVMVKTAPLLDINAAINELKFVKEVHVVAINNDVKEVLYFLKKDFTGSIEYKTINISKHKNQVFNFSFKEQEANYNSPKKYLYEPNSAILKSGAFQELAIELDIDKLHVNSHLYTSDNLIAFPGRRFKINSIVTYNAKKISKLIGHKKANITTRNFPDTVAQIRKKTKLKDGGDLYLFFTTDLNNDKIVLFCEKI